ncbi:MAG: hypothetical protein V1749_11230 [Candidatus Desantisbacteria bacterium]
MKKKILITILLIAIIATATDSWALRTYEKSSSTKNKTANTWIGIALVGSGVILAVDGFKQERWTEEWDHILSEYWYNYKTSQSYYKWYGCDKYDTQDYLWSKNWTSGNIYYNYTYCHHKEGKSKNKNTLKGIGGIVIALVGTSLLVDVSNEALKSTGFQFKIEQENLQTVKILVYKKFG